MATSKRVWDSFEITFRAREMETLLGWVRVMVSGSLVGLPGSGKSNLLGFLSHRPDAATRYLDGAPETHPSNLAIVLVDLNNLPADNLATFYRVILRALYEAGSQLTAIERSLFDTVEALYRKVERESDPFLPQSALREALLCFENRGAHLVLALDPFDQFCQTASRPILDNLRGLRDSFKATLMYIVSLSRELAYIRDPAELGGLYNVLDSRLCWLGPMTQPDARCGVERIACSAGKRFDEQQVERLIDLTGGYPALVRAAALWLAEVSPIPAVGAWEAALLVEATIQNRLNDIWTALTGEERATLFALQTATALASRKEQADSFRQIEDKYGPALARLQAKHICTQTGSAWRLFSPLFTGFVGRHESVFAGKVWCDRRADRFFRGEAELLDLSEQDRRLLRHFLEQPIVNHSVDDLVEAVWEGNEVVSNWLVQQAIRHLRKQIELNPSMPCYLITERGAGYRFFPEGAPRGQYAA